MPVTIADKVDIKVSERVANYLSKLVGLLRCDVCEVWVLDDEAMLDEGCTYCSAECQQEGESLDGN